MIFVFFVSIASFPSILDALKFESAKRVLNLKSHKIYGSLTLNLKNNNQFIEDRFQMIFPQEACQRIYFFNASTDGKAVRPSLQSSPSTSKYCYYQIPLNNPLKHNESVIVNIEVVFSKRFKPFPAKALQNTPQYFLFEDSQFIESIYHIDSQETDVLIEKSKILAFTTGKDIRQRGDRISIGPLHHSDPFREEYFFIHFTYDHPMLMIDKMSSSYQLSEWGWIKVMHEFWIHNDAASLKSGYSRFHDMNHDTHAAYSWDMEIPSNSFNILFRDDLGNISTSSINQYGLTKRINLEPRFPIFGGWHTYYYVSYILSPENFLFFEDGKRAFKVGLIINSMENYLISSGTVKFLLPEGSEDISLNYEKTNDLAVTFSRHHSYLDFFGRPTVEFELNQMCSERNSPIEIFYSYNNKSLLTKPLLVISALFILMISVHVTLCIRSFYFTDSESKAENRLDDVIESIRECGHKLFGNYSSYRDALAQLKLTKIDQSYRNSISKLNEEIECHTNRAELLFKNAKDIDPKYLTNEDLEFMLKNSELKQLLLSYEEITLKVIKGELNRNDYVKLSKPLEENIKNTENSMKRIVRSL